MPLLCFFGPDGSGKSTLSKILVETLIANGFSVKISWMRGTHTAASVIARFFSKFRTFKGSDNIYYGIIIPKSFRRFWQILEFISILPVLFVNFFMPNLLGKAVVAERYLLDFITWVSIETKDSKYLQSFEARFLIALVLKTQINVYVTADLTVLKQRRDDSRDFLQKQIDIYEHLAKSVGAFRLDTSDKNVTESAKLLMTLVSKKFYSI